MKLTFAHGASLPDPAGLFNSSLDGKVRRAIDIHADTLLDGASFQQLLQSAIEYNLRKKRVKKP